MTATERLAQIKARAEAATDGPWEWDPPSKARWPSMDENLWSSPGREPVVTSWSHDADGIEASDEDRAFIAHARTDVPALVAALEAVLELHECITERVAAFSGSEVISWCGACTPRFEDRWENRYPCPTVEAVNEALGDPR